ncbi:hypothetical protein V6N11_064605 [Hibiscus sabdariffa]|uniref:Gnk2-homologous domain-containing protein n=2 Tax=Hibiscus sabdariffa TaxID=183260 RepID=A0ABR2ARI0_9ROSI
MDRVVRKASNGTSSLKYATGEADFTVFQNIYALMQCTPDLSNKDCDSCLRASVSYYESCCHGKQGGYVHKPNCWFRWDLYPFYVSNASTNVPSLSPPPPPASPPPQSVNSTNTKESEGSSSRTLVIIVVTIVIIVAVLVILAVAVLLKSIKKRKQGDQIAIPYLFRCQRDLHSTTETATMTESPSLSNQSKVSVNKASISELDPR